MEVVTRSARRRRKGGEENEKEGKGVIKEREKGRRRLIKRVKERRKNKNGKEEKEGEGKENEKERRILNILLCQPNLVSESVKRL